jgi:hypothetical protein
MKSKRENYNGTLLLCAKMSEIDLKKVLLGTRTLNDKFNRLRDHILSISLKSLPYITENGLNLKEQCMKTVWNSIQLVQNQPADINQKTTYCTHQVRLKLEKIFSLESIPLALKCDILIFLMTKSEWCRCKSLDEDDLPFWDELYHDFHCIGLTPLHHVCLNRI